MQPSAWFLLGTLLLTGVATAMLCGAIMTDHWERVSWDWARIEAAAARRRNASGAGAAGTTATATAAPAHPDVEWLLDGRVARVLLAPPSAPGRRHRQDYGLTPPAVFLVPMHGGIWTLCVSLTEEQCALLRQAGFGQPPCVNYLAPEMSRGEDGKADWQHRMQNLSISCALVCLIILGAAALVGAFGVLQHQISAVLVTGVMYLLAATFAMFTLTIIHFKRHQSKGKADMAGGGGGGGTECISTSEVAAMQVDGVSPSAAVLQLPSPLSLEADFLAARVFATGWSLDLGWGGVTLCVLASVLWILLSKIMRYNPLSSLLA